MRNLEDDELDISDASKNVQDSSEINRYSSKLWQGREESENIQRGAKSLVCQDPFNTEEIIYADQEVAFSIRKFACSLALHLLYYLLLGPALGWLMVGCRRKNQAVNMGFYGVNFSFFLQTQHWLALAVSAALCCRYLQELEGGGELALPKQYLLMLLFQTLLRSVVIAARYATTSDSVLKKLTITEMPPLPRGEEFLIPGWSFLQPHVIDREIKASMIRNEIENLLFRVRLLHPMNSDYTSRFSQFDYYDINGFDMKQTQKMRADILEYLNKQSQVSFKESTRVQDSSKLQKNWQGDILNFFNEPSEEDLDRVYSGRLILKDNFLVSQIVVPYSGGYIRFFITLFFVLIPFTGQYIEDNFFSKDVPSSSMAVFNSTQQLNISTSFVEDPMKKYSHWAYYTYCLVCIPAITVIWCFNWNFLDAARVDMQRKQYYMKVLSCEIEPNRLKLKGQYRLLPLFNFFDQETMQSWLDCRILVLDIGLRFYMRIQIYAVVFFIYCVIMAGTLLLLYFDVMEFGFMTVTQIVTVGLEMLMYGVLLYTLIYAGAQVNAENEKQILRLSELRIIMEKLAINWDFLMNNSCIRKDELMNSTFKKALSYFEHYQRVHGEKKARKLVGESIRGMTSIQERLQQEKECNPIKIMGIPMTMNLIKFVQTGAATLALAMAQKQFLA